ncbi:MAG TPA: hypothetical protein VNY51_09400 [Candidatus Dormibacteraeota bacterium]|jgi:hypothetical protein|nr:hypothetical protein [Candidatus Dormibacteraeota bacterium]
MKFLGDILKRKAPAPAAVATAAPIERDELDDLQADIEAHHAALAGLQNEASAADAKLGEIAGLASALKVRFSEGDANATAALDSLEREELAIRRTRDGLTLRIQTMQCETAPLVARAAELAQTRDAVRQDEVLKDLTARTDAMTAEIIQHWHDACRVGFDLMSALDAAMNGHIPLDAEHKRQALVLNLDVGKKMLTASLAHVNERFAFARPESFHNLRIVPARRRDEPAPAPAQAASTPERKVATGLVWSHPGEPNLPALPRSMAG